MTSLGKWVILARARTALGARKSFSVLLVTAMSAAGLTAVAAAGPAGAAASRTAAHHHAAASSGPAGDETTGSQNDLRDGWDPNEPALTQAAVGGGRFGQIFNTQVNGQVYAQPLVIGNTVIVATENDWVYGLNATTGAVVLEDLARQGVSHHLLRRPHPEHRCHLDAGVRPEHRLGVRDGDGQGDHLAVPPVRARRRHGRHHAAAADRRLAHQRQPHLLPSHPAGPADRPAAAERLGVRGVRLTLRPHALRRLRVRRERGADARQDHPVDRRGRGQRGPGRHLAEPGRAGVRRSRADLLHLR